MHHLYDQHSCLELNSGIVPRTATNKSLKKCIKEIFNLYSIQNYIKT